MSSLSATARARREAGFTLIELLVVIVIIGILSAIAIPVFTAQRGRANDAQVVAAVRSYVTAAETLRADGSVAATGGYTKAQLEAEGARASSSVVVTVNQDGAQHYAVCASHAAGRQYKTGTAVYQHLSQTGRSTRESICTDTGVF